MQSNTTLVVVIFALLMTQAVAIMAVCYAFRSVLTIIREYLSMLAPSNTTPTKKVFKRANGTSVPELVKPSKDDMTDIKDLVTHSTAANPGQDEYKDISEVDSEALAIAIDAHLGRSRTIDREED